MRALRIDYLRAPRSVPWIGYGLLIVAALVAVDVERNIASVEAEVAALRAEARTLSSKAHENGRAARPTVRVVAPEETKAVQAAVRRLTTPWQALFDPLEAVSATNLRLVSIQPDAERREVTIAGLARSYLDILNYLASLKADGRLTRIHLIRHEAQTAEPGYGFGFTIAAIWRAGRV